MKKFLILLAIAFTGIACNEVATIEETMVSITFNRQLVSGHQMTKAEENTFLQIIAEQTPNYVNITLTNTDSDAVFTCSSNESITIPTGNYNISAEYIGTEYEEPSLKCNAFNIDITSETSIVTLNTYYNCYAIFALTEECVCRYIKPATLYEIVLPKYENYYIGYFTDDRTFTLDPINDTFVDTTYEMSLSDVDGKTYAEFGKYYVLHPDGNPNVSSSFTITLPPMVEGEL